MPTLWIVPEVVVVIVTTNSRVVFCATDCVPPSVPHPVDVVSVQAKLAEELLTMRSSHDMPATLTPDP